MNVPTPISLNGGINLFHAPTEIDDQELVKTLNMYPRVLGKLATRPVSEVFYACDCKAQPIFMKFFPANAPARLMIISRSVAGSYPTTISVFDDSGTALTSVDTGGLSIGVPTAIAWQDKIYVFPGIEAVASLSLGTQSPVWIVQKNPGGAVTITASTFPSNPNLWPRVVGIFLDRFVYANLGPGFESAFTFADPFAPTTIKADALAVNGAYALLNSGDGDSIKACVPVFQTGQSTTAQSLLMMKEFSSYLITGQPLKSDGSGEDPGQDGLGTLKTIRMPVNCGCSSQQTVVQTPFGIIWAGPDDVWAFPEGQIPFRIGTKIRPALQASPPTVRYRWHAVYHDGFYKLSLFAPGQGPVDDSPLQEQYWLDLREGLPSPGTDAWRSCHWWGPQIFKTQVFNADTPELGFRCSAVDDAPDRDQSAYSLSYLTVNGAYLLGLSASGAQDCTGLPDVDAALISTQLDVQIHFKDYKNLTLQNQLVSDGIQEKGAHGLEVDAAVSNNGVLNLYASLNGGAGGTQLIASTSLIPDGLILNTLRARLGSAALMDPGGPLVFDSAPTRVVGRTIQFRLTNQPGYFIDTTNNLFPAVIEISPGVFVVLQISIPGGFYVDIDAVGTAIASAMTAMAIGVWTYSRSTYCRFDVSGVTSVRCGSAYGGSVVGGALAQLLGFSTYFTTGYAGSTHLLAETAVPIKLSQVLEFTGMLAKFYTINRRLL